MKIQTIEWQKSRIRMIDQTKLPGKIEYIYIHDLRALWQAIRSMKVRGAPALGAAAALGVYLGVKDSQAKKFAQFKKELDQTIQYIGSSRPTARNLFWALERMRKCALRHNGEPTLKLKRILLREARKVIDEDKAACRRIGRYGQVLIKNNDTVLTICNAGILATIDYGTALGVIYAALARGKKFKVFACETRPMLQGARLTTWELKKKGVDLTLICDSMAAALMQGGRIKKVIAGADRIALNGDTANKVGTYNLAVLCRFHKIPFYIAAPSSTFDLKIRSGSQIPIESRPAKEVTELFFKKRIAPGGIKVFNPAFDLTPNGLISAIITDKGVIRKPYIQNIKKIIKS
ncbi:S-methyl-5-thioribose-1-phosphate isomerase [Candidatus Omnitrophota bacterium]